MRTLLLALLLFAHLVGNTSAAQVTLRDSLSAELVIMPRVFAADVVPDEPLWFAYDFIKLGRCLTRSTLIIIQSPQALDSEHISAVHRSVVYGLLASGIDPDLPYTVGHQHLPDRVTTEVTIIFTGQDLDRCIIPAE